MRQFVAAVLVMGMAFSPAGMPLAAVAQQGGGITTLNVNVERVLTNVVVRDKKTGAVIKDLKVKGSSQTLKRGTIFKSIRVDEDNPEEVECRDGRSTLVLKTCFIKKV